jgi:flagellar FliJ protein
MSFRFSLAAVLRLREIEEEREERALTDLLRQINEVQAAILAIESRLRELAGERDILLRSSQPAREMQETEETRKSLTTRLKDREQQLSRLEELQMEQMARYQQAHRGRKMLSEMRDAQRAVWQAQRLRREQSTADDVFLARRWRR